MLLLGALAIHVDGLRRCAPLASICAWVTLPHLRALCVCTQQNAIPTIPGKVHTNFSCPLQSATARGDALTNHDRDIPCRFLSFLALPFPHEHATMTDTGAVPIGIPFPVANTSTPLHVAYPAPPVALMGLVALRVCVALLKAWRRAVCARGTWRSPIRATPRRR